MYKLAILLCYLWGTLSAAAPAPKVHRIMHWELYREIFIRQLLAYAEENLVMDKDVLKNVYIRKAYIVADFMKISIPKKIVAIGLDHNHLPLMAGFSLRYFEKGELAIYLDEEESSLENVSMKFLCEIRNFFRLQKYITIHPKEELAPLMDSEEVIDLLILSEKEGQNFVTHPFLMDKIRKGGSIWINELKEEIKDPRLKRIPISVMGLQVYKVL